MTDFPVQKYNVNNLSLVTTGSVSRIIFEKVYRWTPTYDKLAYYDWHFSERGSFIRTIKICR